MLITQWYGDASQAFDGATPLHYAVKRIPARPWLPFALADLKRHFENQFTISSMNMCRNDEV